jgi:hypothetical protein
MQNMKLSEPDPDHLIKMLELQLAQTRSKRKGGSRAQLRIAGIAVLVGGTVAAVLLLHFVLAGMVSRNGENATPAAGFTMPQ